MVAVAAVGALAWGLRIARLAGDYRGRADECRNRAVVISVMCFDGGPDPQVQAKAWEAVYARRERLRAHYDSLRQKYERAACCPFLPVAPDPPEPELGAAQ